MNRMAKKVKKRLKAKKRLRVGQDNVRRPVGLTVREAHAVAELAREEGRSYSSQIRHLVREALASRGIDVRSD